MGFSFGSFDTICQKAALIPCPLVGSSQGIAPTCYARNIDIGSHTFFQPSTLFVHVLAIVMTIIMILHVRSKYTAVGRKEILTFFYLYVTIELLAIFLDSGIIPYASSVYPWFAAINAGLVAAAYGCIMLNGFVGFQFIEDGTPASLWGLRFICFIIFGVSFFVAIATFKGFAGFSYSKTTGLWIIYILWPVICALTYAVSQLFLVYQTLEDRWPIGDIVFGTVFFIVAQVILFIFGVQVCDHLDHYIDGLFFYTVLLLGCVMMVYKYWDSITKEDLEFSVGSKATVWEVKDPLLANADGSALDYEDDLTYGHPTGISKGGYADRNPPPSPDHRGGYATKGYPPSQLKF